MNLNKPRVISIILVILLFATTLGSVWYVSAETRHALKASVQDKLIAIAASTASQIDGNAFSALQPGDESTPRFLAIRDQLRAVKESVPGIRYIYTLRRQGDAVAFVVDGDWGLDEDTPGVGTLYPEAEPELLQAFYGPSADREFTTDQWGTVLSGFYPIRDKAGNVVGIVGVDMDSSLVNAELDYLNHVLYALGIVAMLAAILGIIVIERRRESDERKVAESEMRYRLLFERAGDAIFLIDQDGEKAGTIISTNQAADRMYGYGAGELAGKQFAVLAPLSEDGSAVPMELHSPEEEWIHTETRHVKKDGSTFPVECTSGVIDLGTHRHILLICRDISERKKTDDALVKVTRKLAMLNAITFTDIRNGFFTISGFITLATTYRDEEKSRDALKKADESIQNISRLLNFAKSYQDLGSHPPRWQNVHQALALGISHLDMSAICREVHLENLWVFADPMLEQVFYSLASNVLSHARGATQIIAGYEIQGEDLIIVFEDDGPGIPDAIREKIFVRGFGSQRGMELFLVREILSITGLLIHETGVHGKGARFEILVPKGAWRFHGQ